MSAVTRVVIIEALWLVFITGIGFAILIDATPGIAVRISAFLLIGLVFNRRAKRLISAAIYRYKPEAWRERYIEKVVADVELVTAWLQDKAKERSRSR